MGYLNRYFNIVRLSFFLAVLISVSSCNSSSGKKESEKQQKLYLSGPDSSYDSVSNNKINVIMPKQPRDSFPYDLNDPDERYVLPNYLQEISGLTFYNEDNILCLQDERASIYVFNLNKKEIVSKYDFGRDGDYEDIAVIGQTAYIIRSDGKIFGVENFDKEDRKVTEYTTPLSQKNNTEGLMYDKMSNSLFIACKGYPAIEKDFTYEGYKAIYQFDLGLMKLDKKPIFLINLNRPDNYNDYNIFKEFSLRISKKHLSLENEISFHPSGLAIHPICNEIYLISSVGRILIILDRHGKVLDLQELNFKIFRQPEGICFSPSGDLFISSEGDGGKGYILKFKNRDGLQSIK